ncbi:hypothetical protein [Trichloromonas sp.]|uniref:hypothetical protein n=1 Tax=Trichloromonas sp. TaxID=3069249 RepID=UPI003D81BAD0
MWILMKRLLALHVLVLMTAVSAQAALTFGAAPAADSLLQSVPQAQRFGAYLEKHLGEPVDVRIFPNDRHLKEALNSYSDVDLAILPMADMIVVRQGMDSGLLSRIQTVLSGMEQDPEGQTLLSDFGIKRFSLAGSAKPLSTTPFAQRSIKPRSAASRQPAVNSPAKSTEYTLGTVVDPGAPLRSKEAAEEFAAALGQRLNTRVAVREFKDETTLHDWLNRYRMVELALLPGGYLQKQPAGEFELLAQPDDLANQKLSAGNWLVAQQGLDDRQLARFNSSLEQLKGTPLAPLASRPSRPAAVTTSRPTAPPEIIRHTRPTRSPEPPAVFAPASRTATKLTFGAVLAANAPFSSEDQLQTFARLLENRLGTTVNAQSFKDQKTLQEWLSRFRMVDVGLFDESYLQKQPAGEFAPLLPSGELGASAGSRLVGRQGLDKAMLARVRSTLQQMKNDPEVARLFRAPSSVAPLAAAAPAAVPPRPVVEPKPLIVEAPTPAPVVKPVTPAAPPVVQARPAPAILEPKPEPVLPVAPPVVVERLPEAPKPVPLPQAAPPIAVRPAPPEVVFRPSVQREQVYLAPFISVMVPGSVAEKIFDTFVDKLNADGMDRQYEFVILKGGLDSVDPSWLAERSYVTGEIFGYVEESGCCSTDIRTKSRVFLYRQGSPLPTLKHEHPVKIFFDHDYSTIEKERQNIADNIASELSTKVRDALRGS